MTRHLLLVLLLLGGCASGAESRPGASGQRSPDPPTKWGVSGYAVLQGAARWADGKPAANRPVWISCPPGNVVFQTQTDSAGVYERRMALPGLVIVPNDRQVDCSIRLEARPYDPNQTEQTVPVFFARTPEEIRSTQAPVLVARDNSELAHLPTERLQVGFRTLPPGAETPADSIPRAWFAHPVLHVRGRLPLPEQTRAVTLAATRTGPEIRLLFQLEAGLASSRAVSGPAVYDVTLHGMPAGEYTLRIQTMILGSDPTGGREFLPERIIPRVQVSIP